MMKNMSVLFVINEAIHKLESVKIDQPHHLAINELSTVKSYCDLLIKFLTEEQSKEQVKESNHSPTNSFQQDQQHNLLDF